MSNNSCTATFYPSSAPRNEKGKTDSFGSGGRASRDPELRLKWLTWVRRHSNTVGGHLRRLAPLRPTLPSIRFPEHRDQRDKEDIPRPTSGNADGRSSSGDSMTFPGVLLFTQTQALTWLTAENVPRGDKRFPGEAAARRRLPEPHDLDDRTRSLPSCLDSEISSVCFRPRRADQKSSSSHVFSGARLVSVDAEAAAAAAPPV